MKIRSCVAHGSLRLLDLWRLRLCTSVGHGKKGHPEQKPLFSTMSCAASHLTDIDSVGLRLREWLSVVYDTVFRAEALSFCRQEERGLERADAFPIELIPRSRSITGRRVHFPWDACLCDGSCNGVASSLFGGKHDHGWHLR